MKQSRGLGRLNRWLRRCRVINQFFDEMTEAPAKRDRAVNWGRASVLTILSLAVVLVIDSMLTDDCDFVLAITAAIVFWYTYYTRELYNTTSDSNRILSFSGLYVDKKAVEEDRVIKIQNNTQHSVLDVCIISFLISSTCEPKVLYDEIQPFIHPRQPIAQSDILKDFRPDLDLEAKFDEFSRKPGCHLVVGLLTPQMKKEQEGMIFYFENKTTDVRCDLLKFEHRHHNKNTEIYKSSLKYMWEKYEESHHPRGTPTTDR